MVLFLKLVDLFILVFPVVVEWFKKKRSEDETAVEYVKRMQEERRKTYEALLENKGDELSNLAWARIRAAKFVLDGVRQVRESGAVGSGVAAGRTQLPADGQGESGVPMRPAGGDGTP